MCDKVLSVKVMKYHMKTVHAGREHRTTLPSNAKINIISEFIKHCVLLLVKKNSRYIVACQRDGVSNEPPWALGSDKTRGQGSFGPFTMTTYKKNLKEKQTIHLIRFN